MVVALAVTIAILAADAPKPSVDDLAAYRDERAKAGRSADAQIKLALWCESRGLAAERLEHLAIAVAADPANATARGLLGLVADGGRWRKPDDLAEQAREDANTAAALAEYNARRVRAPKSAEGHWKLALWCEETGLKAEATAHLTACVRLDPGRTVAWKRLGFKKVSGRWTTDVQIAADKAKSQAQAAADRRYPALLAAWRTGLRSRDPDRQFEAEKNLNALKDPLAAKSVWRVFVLKAETPSDLARAVQLLGQLDNPIASRGLATMALDAIDPEVRRAATETLARRDPRDYMGDLIGMLRDELRWEVRPVGGPGSQGILYVEGEQFRRARYYGPPEPDLNIFAMGGYYDTDREGFAVYRIPGTVDDPTVEVSRSTVSGKELRNGFADPNDPRAKQLSQAAATRTPSDRQALPSRLFKGAGPEAGKLLRDGDFSVDLRTRRTDTRSTEEEVPIGRIANEFQKSAIAAQAQLEQDLAAVRRENEAIKARSARVAEVLNNVTNLVLAPSGSAWKSWWAGQCGYPYVEPPAAAKYELVENVPLAYTPQPIPGARRVGGVVASRTDTRADIGLTYEGRVSARRMGFFFTECFAAGTLVRTRLGLRPIETLEVGDSVLSQDAATGSLAYQPVTAVYRKGPAETLRLTVGGESFRATPVHRFWRVGEGWVMARDLKPGDLVRTLGGSARVDANESASVSPSTWPGRVITSWGAAAFCPATTAFSTSGFALSMPPATPPSPLESPNAFPVHPAVPRSGRVSFGDISRGERRYLRG